MSMHRSQYLAGSALMLCLAPLGAACGGARPQPTAPPMAAASPATPNARAPRAGPAPSAAGSKRVAEPKAVASENTPPQHEPADQDEAELVVSRDVVARCPTLRLVRAHMSEFDQDMVWLAVLESIAECMSKGGAMAEQTIGVSGDEEHRHVVREVLGTHGVAPTRIVAQTIRGAAECQAGEDCNKRIEITIVAP